MASDLHTHYPLAPEMVERFQRDGHLHLRQVLSPSTLARYRARLAALVAERGSREPLARRTTYGKAFQQVMNLWTVDALVRELVCAPRLARLAADLLGVAGVRLYHDQALYKEPGGGITPWHCDQNHWPLDTHRTCVLWIPLHDVALEMGPLAFASGSHRADLGRDLMIGDESERIIARRITELPLVEEPFACGDVSIHYGYTFHRAGANRTQSMREVMTIIYMDAEARIIAPRYPAQQADWDRWCPGVAVGEVAASPLNPVVYDRAAALPA